MKKYSSLGDNKLNEIEWVVSGSLTTYSNYSFKRINIHFLLIIPFKTPRYTILENGLVKS